MLRVGFQKLKVKDKTKGKIYRMEVFIAELRQVFSGHHRKASRETLVDQYEYEYECEYDAYHTG